MAFSPRLATARSPGGDGTSQQPPETWPVIVMRWLDETDGGMPYVFSLHFPYARQLHPTPALRAVDDAVPAGPATYAFDPLDLIARKDHYPILADRDPQGSTLQKLWASPKIFDRINIENFRGDGPVCMFSVIDFARHDPVFDLFRNATPEQQHGIVVTKAGNDDNRRLALRIEAQLISQGIMIDPYGGKKVIPAVFGKPRDFE